MDIKDVNFGYLVKNFTDRNSEGERYTMFENPNKIYDRFSEVKGRIVYDGYNKMIEYVQQNILTLLSSAVDKKPKALRTITDKDFLVALDMSGIALDREYTNRFNRVYRAYVINPANNVLYNEENACLLGKIAIRMNREMINNLMSLGLSESYALWISVNRNSSTDERRNIRRMVRAMQHMDPDIMTEQMVVNVFSKTFSDQLTNLFISIMTDRFDAFDDDNEKYVYSAVSNAILDILNTMDIDEIKDIVFEYENELKRSGVKGRFSMMAISPGEYPAICRAMDEIEAMGIKIE